MKYLSMAIASTGIIGISAWLSWAINNVWVFLIGSAIAVFVAFGISTAKKEH